MTPGRRRPHAAAPRRRRGVDRRAPRQDRPLLPPRRDLRHDRRRTRTTSAPTSPARATPSRWPTRWRPASCTTPRRSPSPAPTRACSARTCSTRARSCPSSYHRTKFESEKIAREESSVPWRVYRPSVVIGHSKTGEMDKIDGPYYFFKAIQKARHALPEWFPLVGPELGYTNIVPVDYVAAAMDHIAHQPGLDGQAFHLMASKSQRSGEVLNTFAKAAHAPQMAIRIDKRLTDALPKGVGSLLLQLPALKGVRRARSSPTSASPRRSSGTSASPPSSTRATPSARWPAPGSRSRRSTATPSASGTTGSATSTPTSSRTARSRPRSTGARSSSPAPRAASAARPR